MTVSEVVRFHNTVMTVKVMTMVTTMTAMVSGDEDDDGETDDDEDDYGDNDDDGDDDSDNYDDDEDDDNNDGETERMTIWAGGAIRKGRW